MDKSISAIVPCYNEEEIIAKAYNRIVRVLKEITSQSEIIFIDDGSTDNTLGILTKISQQDRQVKVISLSRNFGKETALSVGLYHCSKDLAIILDADLQDPPELIPEMLQVYDNNDCNVVFGVRKKRKKESFFKKVTSKIFYRIMRNLSYIELPVDSADFKLVDRKILDEYRNFGEKNKYVRGLISWLGFKQVPFYYNRDQRIGGKTSFSAITLARLAFTGILYFSKKPLDMIVYLGLVCILVGLILLVYIFYSVLSPSVQSASGWASILTTIVFFSGVQLLTLGVIGKYMGNIFDEVKNRPEYVIKKKLNLEDG